jgi:two-component system response regulator HydG
MDLKKATLLLVDDDKDLLTAGRLLLKAKVKEVLVEHHPDNLFRVLERQAVDLILLDMNFKSTINTGNEGLYWLAKIKERYPAVKVVMITAYAAVDLAVQSLKLGAEDFVVKPWNNEQLIQTLQAALQDKKEKKTNATARSRAQGTELIFQSEVMESLLYKLDKIAPTEANILILGENGTGKDLIAQEIHRKSLRSKAPFVKVDVGALTETLFESELFGYKKGAFTDAREDRQGRFEHAHTGTLFLDEIGNISLQQQSKLLSVLQNRQVLPLGSNQPVSVDIRLVSATNVPLAQLADETRFRKDLIYRINTVEIQVPPLRDRLGDIPLLAKYFLDYYNQKYHRQIHHLDESALHKLQKYHYPGNVRELQYSIERAVIMSDTPYLRSEDILFSPIEQVVPLYHESNSPMSHNLEELEKKTIQSVIDRYQGNISKAAKELGLTRATLYRRLEKYDL